jgi:predicted ATPase
VVLLAGEPGIGKSRLVRTLRGRLENEPHTALSHYCSPHHQTSPLYPVIGLLERAAGFAADDPAATRLDKLEALLALSSDDVTAVAPLLAALLSLETNTRYPPLDLSPHRQKEQTHEVLVDQVMGLAARRPVLLLYEDVHWADPTSLELLDLLVDRVQGARVLVLITFRPEFEPSWTRYAHVTALTLRRLSRRQGAAMVARLSGGKTLPPAVLDQIVAKTDGVPLFVEELTRTVLDANLLKDAGDHYALAGPLPPMAIPATLQESLLARLDRLAPAREVAQVAAAIGREFSHELLAIAAALPESELQAALDDLVGSGLVFRRGTPPQATYSFKHALVQDAAYATLVRAKRQRLHARIAAALEQHFSETVQAQPELLAHHYTEAGLAEPAIDYWLKAGQAEIARSATTEAIAQLTKGLELIPALLDDAARWRRELELQVALGVALWLPKAGLHRRSGGPTHGLGTCASALATRRGSSPSSMGSGFFMSCGPSLGRVGRPERSCSVVPRNSTMRPPKPSATGLLVRLSSCAARSPLPIPIWSGRSRSTIRSRIDPSPSFSRRIHAWRDSPSYPGRCSPSAIRSGQRRGARKRWRMRRDCPTTTPSAMPCFTAASCHNSARTERRPVIGRMH